MRSMLTVVGMMVMALLITIACTPAGGPTVTIVSPSNGATVAHGFVAIKAVVTDNAGVSKVEFYVNDVLKDTKTSGVADTFTGTWDASSATNGAYTIKVKGYSTDNKTKEATVGVTVAGGGPSIHDHDITADTTWYAVDNPHIIGASIQVYSNATLTIMPGCLVKFNSGYELYCGYTDPGGIKAVGKADSIITFTSNTASPAAGDWRNIGIYGSSMPTTQFTYCTFEYGGLVADRGTVYINDYKLLKFDNCTIRQSGDFGVVLNSDATFKSFTNNTITTCTKYPVDIYPEFVKDITTGNTLSGNATGYDGILVEPGAGTSGVVTTATWLNHGVPYVLSGNIEVNGPAGPVLTIAAGNTVKMLAGVEFYCGYSDPGSIIAIGTSAAPIIFTSNVASPAPGDWRNIGLYSETGSTTQFAYCTFEYGGLVADRGMVYVVNNKVVKFDNCTIRQSGDFGVVLNSDATFKSFTNNTITTCTKYPVDIYPEFVKDITTGNTLTGNAAGYDGILVEPGTGSNGVVTNATWLNHGVPYVLDGNIEVSDAAGPVLTIAPGTTIKLSTGAEFYCGYSDPGSILADGTSGQIVFTSRLASPAPGSWRDIGFYSQSGAQSMLKHCRIEYGGSNNEGNVVIENTSAPVILNDSIGHSANWGIYQSGSPLPDSASLINNNTFYNNTLGSIRWP